MMIVWDHLDELREERLVIRKFQGKMLTFKVSSSICNVLGRRRDRRYFGDVLIPDSLPFFF